MAERANNVVEANALIKLTTNQSSEIGKMIALTSKSDVIFSTVKIIFLLDYPKNNMISIYVTMKKIKEEYGSTDFAVGSFLFERLSPS